MDVMSHFVHGEISLLLVFTVLFITAAVAFSLWSTRRIHPEDMMGEDLAKAGREIAMMRKRGLAWKKAAYPVLALWFIWVVIECFSAGMDNELLQGFLLGCGLGMLGALICTAVLDRRQNAMLDGFFFASESKRLEGEIQALRQAVARFTDEMATRLKL